MRKLFLFLVLGIFLISLASSEISLFVPRGEPYDLQVKCSDDSQFLSICTPATVCNITISYPNSTILINNSRLTNLHNGKFNITLDENQTKPSGEYTACFGCSNTTISSSTCFNYEVNPPGIRQTESRTEALTRAIYFMTFIGLILFAAAFFVKNKPPVKWTLFIFGFIFFLIAINLLFIGIADEVVNPRLESFFDTFTAISFIMYWGAAGFLIIIWLITMLNTWVWKKNMENIRKFGGDEK